MAEPAPVIAIDGPSGSGKGTVSRSLARRLGWHWLDSGALYRLVALAGAREGLDPEQAGDIARAAELARELPVRFASTESGDPRVMLAGEDVTVEMRDQACGDMASLLAGRPAVREGLLQLQRDFRRSPGLVADGRDMGTVVFPGARLKIFLRASVRERASRRQAQLLSSGIDANFRAVYAEITDRDRRDETREHAPLAAAPDARRLDTTTLAPEAVVEKVLNWAREVGLTC